MWGIVQKRRMQPVRIGVFFMLVMSLLVPYPAIIAAQEVESEAPVEETSSETETASPQPEVAPAETVEDTPIGSESESVEPKGGEEEGGEEPPPEGLLDDEQAPDPEYGDDRAPRVRQPTLEPDQLDGSLRYVHPLIIPPGRNGMQPDLALVYSSRSDEQISPFGYGWSLNIPYIERVNRRGVDKLYTDHTFFSTLDGELASTTGGQGGIGDLAGEEAALNAAEPSPLALEEFSTEESGVSLSSTTEDFAIASPSDESQSPSVEEATPEVPLIAEATSTQTVTKDGPVQNPLFSVIRGPVETLLFGKAAVERAEIKGRRLANLGPLPRIKRTDYDIEIVSLKSIPGGVEVFARAWNEKGQVGFGKDGSVDIERFRFINPPVLVDDPRGNIVRTWFDERSQTTKERRLREDPQEALLLSLEHAIKTKKEQHNGSAIVEGKVGNTTTVVYPHANPSSTLPPVEKSLPQDGMADGSLITPVLLGKTISQKASIKGEEIAKIGPIERTARAGYDVEIVSMNAFTGGLQVFVKAWNANGRIGFGKDGSVEMERIRIFNPPILVPDPDGTIVREGTDPDGKKFEWHYREDPQEALFQVLEKVLSAKKEIFDDNNIVSGKVGNTTSIFYSVAGANSPVDGRVDSQVGVGAGGSWSTIRNGNGTANSSTDQFLTLGRFRADTTSNIWRGMSRGFSTFDTSALGAEEINSASITGTVLDKEDGNSANPSYNVYVATLATTTAVANADFQGNVNNTTTLSSNLSYANVPAIDSTLTFDLNASGTANINMSGISQFQYRSVEDATNSAPSSWSSDTTTNVYLYSVDETGTTKDPFLTVEGISTNFAPTLDGYVYSRDAGGPGSFSNARNDTDGFYANYTNVSETEAAKSSGGAGAAPEDDYEINRAFFIFDTSSIPDTDTIHGATLSVYVANSTYITNKLNDGNDYIAVIETRPASTTSLSTDDFDQVRMTDGTIGVTTGKDIRELSDQIDLTNDFFTGAYNTFILNTSGIAAISATSTTKLGLAEGHDILEIDPGTGVNSVNGLGFTMADQTGSASDPVLVVEHDDGTVSSSVTYGPKIDNGDFRKYTFVNERYWQMTDKFGTIYTFGASTTARQYAPNNTTHTYRWMLEEVRDRNGNYISYTYYRQGNQFYPQTITYTGNGTTPGIFTVEFSRELRDDITSSYKPGFRILSQYRINQILASINGSWVRKYDIAYGSGDNGERSVITSITETGRDEQATTLALPASTMAYQTSTDSWGGANWHPPVVFAANLGTANGQDNGARIADFTGDGLPDIMRYRTSASDSGSNQKLFVNNGDGTWATTSPSGLQAFVSVDGYDCGVRIADINGDGLADFADNSSYYINSNNGQTFTSSSSTPFEFIEGECTEDAYDLGARLVDLNGDGLADFARYAEGGSNEVFLNTSSGWALADDWALPPVPVVVSVDSQNGVDNGVRFEDFNGDGLVDAMQYRESGSAPNQQLYFNQGDGTWTSIALADSVSPFVSVSGVDKGNRIADVNADGLADIIKDRASEPIFLNTGLGQDFVEHTAFPSQPYTFVHGSSFYDLGTRLADLNGDGMVDFINGYTDASAGSAFKQGDVPDMLVRATDKLGATTNVIYKAASEYRTGTARKNKEIPFAMQTVQELGLSDGFGTIASTTFEYAGGDYYYNNAFDRRFAGFATTTATNGLGFVTKTYAHQGNWTNSTEGEYSDDQSKIGKPYRTEVYDGSSNLYAKTINEWVNVDLGNDRDFVKRTQTIDFAFDGDSDHKDKAETYAYDNDTGNVTTRIEYGAVTGSDNGTFTDVVPSVGNDKFATSITYAASTTLHLVGLPSQETVVNSASTTVKDTKFYYDSLAQGSVSKGNETKREMWKSGSSWIDTEKSYDGTYGLVTEEKDPRNNATTYTYEANNLYIATSTNAKGHTTGYVYDYSIGKPKRTNDPHNLIFEVTYDALDRVIAEKQPDLSSPATLATKAAYTYTDTIGSRSVLETRHLNDSISKLIYRYLDGLDRPVQERAEHEDYYAVKDFEYNEIGKIDRESLPYFSSGTSRTTATTSGALFARTAYDPLGRVTSFGTAVGTTTHTYDDWKQTTTDPNGEIKDFVRDAYGNLASTTEHIGSSLAVTTYTWNYLKNLATTTDALDNVRGFTYDGLGRRLTAQDLHAPADTSYGTWTYVYDNTGNLATTTDPNSQTVEYIYDELNRVTSEDYTGAAGTEVTYTYDNCIYGKTRLCGATTTAAGLNYTYNALGGRASERNEIGPGAYTTSYTYDRQGNPTGITYPDGATVAYGYNAAGLLETVTKQESGVGAITLVEDTDYSPTGQATYREFGNNTEATFTYDANKLYRLTNILTTATSTGETFGTGGIGDLAEAEAALNALNTPTPQPFALHQSSDDNPPSIESMLLGHTSDERATIKGEEIAELVSIPRTERADYDIEVVSMDPIEGGVQVFVKAWNEEGQIGFGNDGSVEIERFRIYNPAVLVPDPEGAIIREGTDIDGNEFEWHYREDLQEALLQMLEKTLAAKTEIFDDSNIIPGKIGNTTSVFYSAAGANSPVDGRADSQHGTGGTDSWSTIRNGNGTANSSTDQFLTLGRFRADTTSNTWRGMSRGFSLWNTAAIGTDTISAASITGTVLDKEDGNSASPSYNVYQANLGSSSAVANSDFQGNVSYTTTFSTSVAYSSIPALESTMTYTLNANGIANISTTSISKFQYRSVEDATNTAPSGWSSDTTSNVYFYTVDETGTTKDPFLTVEHAGVAPTAPTSLLTEGQTNPVDITDPTPEFSAIYQDGEDGDLSTHYKIQVATTSAFTSTYWDSGQTALASSTPEGNRIADISYSGSTLASSTTYYWRIKFWDDASNEGEWSSTQATFSLATGTVSDLTNIIQNISYTYDNVGNITRITDNSATGAGHTVLYTYDDLHRLTNASTTAASSTPYIHGFTYSIIGNITTASSTGSYTYAGTNYANPHAVTSINGVALTYDNNGNLTNYGNAGYSWDYRNQMTLAGTGRATSTYGYDYTGQRVSMRVGSTASTTYANRFFSTNNASTTKHIFAGDMLIASVEKVSSATTTHIVHPDHLGGTNVVTDADGSVVQTLDYYPFGAPRIDTASSAFDERREFTGHEYDETVDLTYANARYYNQDVGRWVSMDTASRDNPEQFLTDPQQLNTYSYGRNNPLILVDRDGRKVELMSRAVPFDGTLGVLNQILGPFGHSFLLITPESGSNLGVLGGVDTSKPFTVSADFDESNGTLVKSPNGDIRYAKGCISCASVEVKPPSGVTQVDFERNIVRSYNAMPQVLHGNYGEFMGEGIFVGKPNSNNAATSFLTNAGVSKGTVSGYQSQLYAQNSLKTPGLGVPIGGSVQSQVITQISQLIGALQGLVRSLQASLSSKSNLTL